MNGAWLLGWGILGAAEDNPSTGDEFVVEDKRATEVDEAWRSPASATVFLVDERLPPSSTVSTVVATASGATVTSLGGLGDWSGVSIRGSTLRQVQISLDGVPLNPDGADAVNLAELPLWAWRSITLYRGNAPPELSTGAIGGAIDLQTGERPEGVAAVAAAGSYNTVRATTLGMQEGTIGKTPVDAFLVADFLGTSGAFSFLDDNGTRYTTTDDRTTFRANNDKRQLSTHARLRLGDNRLRWTLLEAFLQRDEGLPGHSGAPTETVRLDTRRALTTLAVDGRGDNTSATGRLWWLHRAETYDDRAGELGVGTQWNQNTFDTLGVLGNARWAWRPTVVPAVTASARQDRYLPTDLSTGQSGVGATRFATTAAISATAYFWQERLTLAPVMQTLWLTSATEAAGVPDDQRLSLLPRAGVSLQPWTLLGLRANVARGVRPPDFTELFGDRGAVIGNPALRPETGVQWDYGIRLQQPPSWSRAQVRLDVARFRSRTEDLIVMVQNSQQTMIPVNLDDAWVGGFETTLALQWPHLTSTTNVTHTVSANLSTEPQFSNNQLPRVPAWQADQQTAWMWDTWVRVGHTWSYTAGNYWDRTNFYLAPPRSFHGAFVMARPAPKWPSISLDVRNLFDQRTEDVPRNPLHPVAGETVTQAITDFVGYPLPGRTFLLTVRWETTPEAQ